MVKTMTCVCGYKGHFEEIGNAGGGTEMLYILKPGMQSKYEGLISLYACPECKTVKVG